MVPCLVGHDVADVGIVVNDEDLDHCGGIADQKTTGRVRFEGTRRAGALAPEQCS
jgi:hypothetical protein